MHVKVGKPQKIMISVVIVNIAIHVTRLIRWKQKYSVEVYFTGFTRTADITLLY